MSLHSSQTWPPPVGSVWAHANGIQRFRVDVAREDHVEVTMLADYPDAPPNRRLTVAEPRRAWHYVERERASG